MALLSHLSRSADFLLLALSSSPSGESCCSRWPQLHRCLLISNPLPPCSLRSPSPTAARAAQASGPGRGCVSIAAAASDARNISSGTSGLVSLADISNGILPLTGRFGRPDTKEKPFVCFCGAAFTRRDLLKRHTRISHQEGPVSPNSQLDQDIRNRHSDLQARDSSAVQYPYDVPPEPRPDVPLHAPPAAGQWTGSRQGPYLGHNQGMIATGDDAALGTSAAVTPDEDILQAAQLLLPSTFRDTCQPLNHTGLESRY